MLRNAEVGAKAIEGCSTGPVNVAVQSSVRHMWLCPAHNLGTCLFLTFSVCLPPGGWQVGLSRHRPAFCSTIAASCWPPRFPCLVHDRSTSDILPIKPTLFRFNPQILVTASRSHVGANSTRELPTSTLLRFLVKL